MKTIGAAVEFKCGTRPIKNFSMVERHFFRNKLLKSFVFEFGFVIPEVGFHFLFLIMIGGPMKTHEKSINNAEHIYEVPKLDKKTIQEIIANPYETRSGWDPGFFGNFATPRKSVP